MKKLFNFRLLVLIGVLIMSVPQLWAYNEYGKKYLYFNGVNFTSFFDGSCTPYISPKWDYTCNDGNNNGGDKQMTRIGTSYAYYLDLSQSVNNYTDFRGFYIGRCSSFYNGAKMGYEHGSDKNCIWANNSWGSYGWGYYAVPISSIALAGSDNIISGTGTSSDPYIVAVGNTITLTATPTFTPADNTMSFCANFGPSPASNPTTVQSSSTYTVSSTSKVELKCIGRNKYGDVYSADVTSSSVWVQGVTSYTLTYSVGDVAGNNGSISSSPTTSSGASVQNGTVVTLTAPNAASGYSWQGWYANSDGSGAQLEDDKAYAITMDDDMTVYACYTENDYSVSVVSSDATYAGTVGSSSVTGHVSTSANLPTASPKFGYRFVNWEVTTGTASITNSTSASGATINGMTADCTVRANFTRVYAFIEGRFHVQNAARNSWTNTFNTGDWDANSANIEMADFDKTNHRYILHTHATPNELTTQISSRDPVFFIKLSKSSSNVEGGNYYTHYWSATDQTLSAAGTANKKALTNTGTFFNNRLKFNSSTTSGYAAIYFDGSDIWYELEQRLQYNGNGASGSAPATHNSYYKTGTNATVASNTYTKTGYYFTGWKTGPSSGTSYAAGASVPMSADVTLYAQWSICQATISFEEDGGSTIADQTATWGSAMPSISKPTKDGYTLVGIYDDPVGGTQYYDENGASARNWDKEVTSATLYVRWAQEFSVSIAAKKDEADISEYTPVSPVTANTTLPIEVSAPVIPGYTFANWTLGSNITKSSGELTDNPIHITATAASTLTANYNFTNYTVTYPDAATAHCVYGAKDASVAYTSTGRFVVTPAAGYSISVTAKDATEASVEVYKNGDTYSFVQGTSAVTIVITPSENNNTVTIINGKETGGSATEVTASVVTTAADVTADNAPEGKKFLTWSFGPGILLVDCDTTDRAITFNASQSTTITATYTDRSKVTVHFAKPYEWNAVTAVFSNSGSSPSDRMSAVGEPTVYEGATYYTFSYYIDNTGETGGDQTAQAAWNQVVFSDENGNHSLSAITFTNGYYYAKGDTDGRSTPYAEWYLRGLLNGTANWNTNKYDHPFSVEGSSAEYAFGAEDKVGNDNQYFRIYRISTGECFVYNITSTSNVLFPLDETKALSPYSGDKANQIVTDASDKKGVYLFTLTNINNATPSLKVTHPKDTKSGVTITAGANGSLAGETGDITELGRYMPTAISATANAGYRFKEWVTTGGVVVDDPTNRITTATATAAGTITATFTNKYIVYFDKANINDVWTTTPYVYFYSGSYWNNEKGSGSKNILWGGQAMTNIGGTTIWYYDYSGTKLVDEAKQYIAFTNGDKSGQDNFDEASVVYRSDYYPDMNMYVPHNYIDQYLNKHNGKQTCYYEQGYWMKYREEQPGYNLRVYDGQGRNLQETIPFRTANIEARDAYTATVHVDGAAGAKLELIGHDQGYVHGINYTGSFYGSGGTINSSLTNWDWALSKDGGKIYINLNSSGDYVFGLNCGTDGKLHFKVTFPISVGDFRIKYNGLVTTKDASKDNMYSDVIPHLTEDGTRKDTVSFFVTNQVSKTAALSLEECTEINTPNAGDITWSSSAKGFSGDAITSLTSGVYMFEIVQTRTSGTTSFTYTNLGKYSGDYYVRTDWADGGWVAYKQNEDNLMPATNYASAGFTNYHCHYVSDGSVKFCVANKYNSQLSKQISSDTLNASGDGSITISANTRFEYDTTTNVVSRSYLGASDQPTFLYIRDTDPDKIFKDDGTSEGVTLTRDTAKFIDNENWIYTLEVLAIPGATYKLEAVINGKTQYFVGTKTTPSKLIGGSGGAKQKMRLVYDYKNNHMIKAFIPEGVIGSNLEIEADLMIIREHQEQAQQINFSGTGKLSEVQTVYGAMRFNKWTVNNKSKTGAHATLIGENSLSQYERDLFWISFPFEVKLSDAFGFGEYGTHWIIEYYDGKGRAKNGFWADSEPNWKFVTPSMRDTFKLKAFEGYILALDLAKMGEGSSVWDHGVEDVYVYFPSNGNVGLISATERTVDIDQIGYECIINRATPDGNRTIKDSYWHCIGVPSFADYNSAVASGKGSSSIDWRTGSMPYLYEWNKKSNTLSVTTSTTFKFEATYSYLVQYAGEHIYWSAVNTPTASVAARLAETPDKEYKLELLSAERTEDQTFIRLTDDANVTTGFEFNYDLSKEMNKNSANIYTLISTTIDNVPSITEAAANVQPHPLATTIVPVGVKIATTGEYTFTMPEGTNGENVWLLDNQTGSRTNLGLMDYTVTLTSGTYDGRFALEFGPIQDAPTGIDEMSTVNSQLSTDSVRKVFVGGRLYIIRDGKAYDATGKRVE